MKIEIDTNKKELIILEKVTINELQSFIDKFNLHDYTLNSMFTTLLSSQYPTPKVYEPLKPDPLKGWEITS